MASEPALPEAMQTFKALQQGAIDFVAQRCTQRSPRHNAGPHTITTNICNIVPATELQAQAQTRQQLLQQVSENEMVKEVRLMGKPTPPCGDVS
jgi:hypothetical protein